MMARERRYRHRNGGFTLLEICVVLLIIAIVSAVALPQLLPVIMFSELEGAARHLSNYGRSAMSEATLYRETYTIYFDLDNQEYYSTHLVYPAPLGEKSVDGMEDEAEEINHLGMLAGLGATERTADEINASLQDYRMGNSVDPGFLPKEFDNEAASAQMRNKFSWFSRQILEIRADNVKHDEFLGDAGNLFDEYDFDLEMPEPEEVELHSPLLERTRLPEGVRLMSLVIGGTHQQYGQTQVVISPLGLNEPVTLYLMGADDEYYTVYWNPMTADARYYVGYYDANQLL